MCQKINLLKNSLLKKRKFQTQHFLWTTQVGFFKKQKCFAMVLNYFPVLIEKIHISVTKYLSSFTCNICLIVQQNFILVKYARSPSWVWKCTKQEQFWSIIRYFFFFFYNCIFDSSSIFASLITQLYITTHVFTDMFIYYFLWEIVLNFKKSTEVLKEECLYNGVYWSFMVQCRELWHHVRYHLTAVQ